MALVQVLSPYQATKGQAVGLFYSVITVHFVTKQNSLPLFLPRGNKRDKRPRFDGFISTFCFNRFNSFAAN